jgi:hypothetical protein
MTDSPKPLLSKEMRRRAEALAEARRVLAARTPISAGPVDAIDMHSLAVFILDGGDPWALDDVKVAEPAPKPRARLSFSEHAMRTKGGSHGFIAHEGIEVTVEKREGCEPWCEVKHDGVVLFRGGDGSASRLREMFHSQQVVSAEAHRMLVGRVEQRAERAERDAAAARAQAERAEQARERAERERNDARDLLFRARADVSFENEKGGEARQVVLTCANVLGIDLARDPSDGQMWSPKNMQRVQRAVRALVHERRSAVEVLVTEPAMSDRATTVIDKDGDEWTRGAKGGPWCFDRSGLMRTWDDLRSVYAPLFASRRAYEKAVGR